MVEKGKVLQGSERGGDDALQRRTARVRALGARESDCSKTEREVRLGRRDARFWWGRG